MIRIKVDEIKSQLDLRIVDEPFQDLKDLFDWFDSIELEGYEDLVAFDDQDYNRVMIIESDAYDLLLCCWKPGQGSPLHGHPSCGCLMKMLIGRLNEEQYLDGILLSSNQYQKHVTAYITDEIALHKVSNETLENAVSLHLYAPGGYTPTYY